jgi:hypothetical protein
VFVRFGGEGSAPIHGVEPFVWNVVARDGIEPPTPAFSGPPADPDKGLWNLRNLFREKSLSESRFGLSRAQFGCFRAFRVRVLFARNWRFQKVHHEKKLGSWTG